jgi:hypothetical protein
VHYNLRESQRERERFVIFIYKNFLIIEPSWHLGKIVRAPPLLYYKSRAYPCVAPTSRALAVRAHQAGYMHICAMYFLSNKHTTRLPCFLSILSPSVSNGHCFISTRRRWKKWDVGDDERRPAGQTGPNRKKGYMYRESEINSILMRRKGSAARWERYEISSPDFIITGYAPRTRKGLIATI